MAWSQGALRIVLTVITLGIGVQFFFAGAGAFGATSYDTHKTIGSLLVLAAVLALALAFAARSSVVPVAIGLVLLILQAVLGHNGFAHPWLGAIHGANALAIGAVFGTLTGRKWQALRDASAGPG
jgi:uncharacterized membrane protein YccC